jgi:Acetate kinase
MASFAGKLKGQVDGIGTLPRLRATGFNGETLADFNYSLERVADVPAALMVAGSWLREEHRVVPIAIGHRVVHGGPDMTGPFLSTTAWLRGWSA